MKLIHPFGILAMCMAFFSMSSCSSDSDSKIKVKYAIHSDTNIITDIKYKKADGTTADIITETGPDWEKTINVDKPFDANLIVTFNNTAASMSNYFLLIYVNGESEPSGYVTGAVAPNSVDTGTADFNIPE